MSASLYISHSGRLNLWSHHITPLPLSLSVAYVTCPVPAPLSRLLFNSLANMPTILHRYIFLISLLALSIIIHAAAAKDMSIPPQTCDLEVLWSPRNLSQPTMCTASDGSHYSCNIRNCKLDDQPLDVAHFRFKGCFHFSSPNAEPETPALVYAFQMFQPSEKPEIGLDIIVRGVTSPDFDTKDAKLYTCPIDAVTNNLRPTCSRCHLSS